jgi:hypothetical protein
MRLSILVQEIYHFVIGRNSAGHPVPEDYRRLLILLLYENWIHGTWIYNEKPLFQTGTTST